MAIQDSGSNYQFYDKKINPNIKRSSFQLDYLNTFTAKQGKLIPYRLQYTLPNSDYNLAIELLARAANVPRVPLASRQRIFLHEYGIPFNAMWSKFGTFMSKGRSGNTVLPLPKIRFSYSAKSLADAKALLTIPDGYTVFSLTKLLNYVGFGPESLTDYLGFPTPPSLIDLAKSVLENPTTNGIDTTLKHVDFNAFPFFAYLSVWRNYYVNPNLMTENKHLWPDDENDFALVSPDISDQNIFYAGVDTAKLNGVIDSSKYSNACFLNFGFIKNRNFVDDYFTSALPWPMRGEIPSITQSAEALAITLPLKTLDGAAPGKEVSARFFSGSLPGGAFSASTLAQGSSSSSTQLKVDTEIDYTGATPLQVNKFGGLFIGDPSQSPENVNVFSSKLGVTGNVNFGFTASMTWEMIRNLSISTLISEKMARTDGSYLEFIRTFFDSFPENQPKNRPVYIGGALQPIVYSEVLQTVSTDNSPLGMVGAKGIASTSDYISKYHAKDFGVILGIMSIMPDTYYSQGLRRQDLYEVQEDFFLPERSELGLQGIFNAEIFFQNAKGDDKDDDLFGYQNRYDEWRYRANEVHGEIANPNSESFFPYTQSRFFTDTPKLSVHFVSTLGNIRLNYLTSLDETQFMVQIANKCTAVQPLPYKAIPVGLK